MNVGVGVGCADTVVDGLLASTASVKVPALHICAGPAPALYCTGLDTGIVVDIGSREAHVVAVYRGAHVLGSYTGAGIIIKQKGWQKAVLGLSGV